MLQRAKLACTTYYNHFIDRRFVIDILHSFYIGPRVQTNALTSPIDGNFIYGSNEDLAKKLRSFENGKLTLVPILPGHRLKPILPPKKHQPDDGCIRPHPDLFCFLAG